MVRWLEEQCRRWEAAAQKLRQVLPGEPRLALIAGSGVSEALPGICLAEIPYAELPDFPCPSVAGHPGVVELRRVGEVPVLAFCGRVHLYEGYSIEEVVAPVVLAALLRSRAIIMTSAAGAVSDAVAPGDILNVRAVLNVTFRSLPLVLGRGHTLESLWWHRVRQRLAAQGLCVPSGVYAAVLGPSYETPAEVRMLSRLGADVVGMSTAHELHCAGAVGMQVLAFSVVTNWAAGRSARPLSHCEVLHVLRHLAPRLRQVLEVAVLEAPVG